MERTLIPDDRSRTLRLALIGNALFSAASGAAFVLAGGHIARLAGLPGGLPLQLVGIGLLPFAAYLFWLAERPEISAGQGRVISAMDAQWVLGTLVLLIGWPDLLNATGQALALAIAAVVSVFGIWQLVGSRQLAAPACEAHG
jgi:hypothetical protein